MIQLKEIKQLLLTQPSQVNRPAHLSAASGLVKQGRWLYVVADDELHIAKFNLDGEKPGSLFRCFDGELPLETEERKAQKPDVEVLTLIQQLDNPKQTALLAMGSGSKKNRRLSAIIPLDNQGNISAPAQIVDLENFYGFLKDEIGALNIEGATIVQDDILLFQRGNKKNKLNASVRIKLNDFYRLLEKPNKHYKPDIKIESYDLGQVDQVPYCFTDATSLPNGKIVFTASAENTSDSYLDGLCLGSILGIINQKGKLEFLDEIDKKIKLEGVAAESSENSIGILLVSDADDATAPAKLYSTHLNHPHD
jgi:hypothetical protein